MLRLSRGASSEADPVAQARAKLEDTQDAISDALVDLSLGRFGSWVASLIAQGKRLPRGCDGAIFALSGEVRFR